MTIKPFTVRGHTVALTQVGRDWDVRIEKGAFVVVGIFDAGGLTLSEHTPSGERVKLRASLVDAFEAKIESVVEGDGDDEDEDDDDSDE